MHGQWVGKVAEGGIRHGGKDGNDIRRVGKEKFVAEKEGVSEKKRGEGTLTVGSQRLSGM